MSDTASLGLDESLFNFPAGVLAPDESAFVFSASAPAGPAAASVGVVGVPAVVWAGAVLIGSAIGAVIALAQNEYDQWQADRADAVHDAFHGTLSGMIYGTVEPPPPPPPINGGEFFW